MTSDQGQQEQSDLNPHSIIQNPETKNPLVHTIHNTLREIYNEGTCLKDKFGHCFAFNEIAQFDDERDVRSFTRKLIASTDRRNDVFCKYSGQAFINLAAEFMINHVESLGMFIVDVDNKIFNDAIYLLTNFRLIRIISDEFKRFLVPELLDIVNFGSIMQRIIYRTKNFPEVKLHKNYFYDIDTNRIYFSDRFTGYYVISDTSITHFFNGENQVFFLNHDDSEFINVDLTSDPEYCFMDFFQLFEFDELYMSKYDYSRMLYAFMLAVVFESLIVEKPIFLLTAEKGSGKTTLGRAILRFLTYMQNDVIKISDKEDEMDVLITNSNFNVLDNVETMPKWMLDTLAIASTSGKKPKRKLYTTNEMVEFKYNCFNMITAINPKLSRSDLVDRLLIANLKRFKQFKTTSSVYPDEAQLKDAYLIFFHDLQRMLRLLPNENYNSDFRLAEFFRVFIVALKVIGADVKLILEKIDRSLQDYICDEEQLITIIKNVLDGDLKPEGETFGSDMSAEKMLSVFKSNGLTMNLTARSLVAKLKNLQSNLEKLDIIFDRSIGKGNRKNFNICYKNDLKKDVQMKL